MVAAVVLVRREAAVPGTERKGAGPRREPGRPAGSGRSGKDGIWTVPGAWYLVLAACLFGIGAVGRLLVRRNIRSVDNPVEPMLNAVNLTFVTFSRMLNDLGGQDASFFVLVVAATAGGHRRWGIIVAIYRRRSGATADDISSLKG